MKKIGASLSARQKVSPISPAMDDPPESSVNAELYYDLMLESCERLFDNEIEPSAFEEQMRAMFGTKVRLCICLDNICSRYPFLGCLQTLYD